MGDQSHHHLPLYAGLCTGLLTSYDFNLDVILFMTHWWLSGEESGLIPQLGRFPCRREWHPFQYSGLEKSMGRGDWKTTLDEVTYSQTQLSK